MSKFVLLAVLLPVCFPASDAQTTLGEVPACGQVCLSNNFGSCGQLNIKCICSDKTLMTNLAKCIRTTCSAPDQNPSYTLIEKLCESNGVTYFFIVDTTNTTSLAPTPTNETRSTLIMSFSSEGLISSIHTTRSTRTTAGTNLPTANSANATTASSSSLPTGAAVGLGIGVTLGVVGLVVAVFFFWRYRRQSTPTKSQPDAECVDKPVTELDANEPLKASTTFHEADGNPRGELEDRHGTGVARHREGLAEAAG